jgi:hypothetical protein
MNGQAAHIEHVIRQKALTQKIDIKAFHIKDVKSYEAPAEQMTRQAEEQTLSTNTRVVEKGSSYEHMV